MWEPLAGVLSGGNEPSPKRTRVLYQESLRRAAHARPLDRRALVGAAALGGAVGLIIGGAYLAGGMARAAVVHAQIARLADAAAEGGFSDAALAASQAEDPGALAIARRLDPYNAAEFDPAQRDVALVSRLETGGTNLIKASFGAPDRKRPAVIPALPYRFRAALDETRELQCLTEAVYYEARGETAAGQAAVAQVVLNRTRHPAYPKSICGVVFQGSSAAGCQFSFACNGSIHRRVEPWAWRRAEKVAARAMDGYVMPEVGQATHFHVAGLSPDWQTSLLKVAQVGAHVFYRFGRNARPAPFTPQAPEAPITPAGSGEMKPIYASLSLAPVADAVANSAVNAVTAGAGLVMAAANSIKPTAAEPARTEVVKADQPKPLVLPAPDALAVPAVPPVKPLAAAEPTAPSAS